MKRTVVRVDKSPMNPARKCVELDCGHEIWVNRAPSKGSQVECNECDREQEKAMKSKKKTQVKVKPKVTKAEKATGKLGVGKIVGVVALTNAFDRYVRHVLFDYVKIVEGRKRGARRQYKIVKALPTAEDYNLMRDEKYSQTVSDLVSDAYSEFDSLASELNDWKDGLPENLQGGDKYSALEDAAQTLEYFSEPDVPESIKEEKIVFLPDLNCESRSDRCQDAAGKLQSVVDFLESKYKEKPSNPNEADEGAEPDSREEMPAALSDFYRELGETINNVEGVEFPGMY